MKNGGYKISIETRLTRLETVVAEIKDNHLVHMEAKIDRIHWLIITTLITVLVSVILKLL